MRLDEIVIDKDFWVTNEGYVLWPEDFQDSHLVNTIRFLHRKFKSIAEIFRNKDMESEQEQGISLRCVLGWMGIKHSSLSRINSLG